MWGECRQKMWGEFRQKFGLGIMHNMKILSSSAIKVESLTSEKLYVTAPKPWANKVVILE